MPANAVQLAEHYVLLTRNLLSTAKGEGPGDLGSLFDARDKVLAELLAVDKSEEARQILLEASAVEAEFQATVGAELEQLRTLLCGRYQEKKGVTRYLKTESQDSSDDSIAC